MSASAVGYKSSVFHSKMSDSNKCASESRDLRAQCDQLRKELERKDTRNEKTAKEMQQLRASFAGLQRELRMTTSTIDKIKSEKSQFEIEAADLRCKNQLLTRKLKTANDPQGLIDQISRDKKSHAFLEEIIVNLKGELSLREQKMEALTKELVIAHRSIDVQSKYESMPSAQSSVSQSREIMRSLYFDMGKKQADLHSVTLALAEATHRISTVEEELVQALRAKRDALQDNEKLVGNVEYLSRQAVEFSDNISHLRKELEHGASLTMEVQQRLEVAACDASSARARYGEESVARQLQIEELSSAAAIAEQEREAMKQALDSAKQLFNTKELAFAVREEESQRHVFSLRSANIELAEKAQLCSALQTRVESLQKNLAGSEHSRQQQDQRISELLRLLSEKEVRISDNSASVIALDANLMSVHAELTSVREQLQLVTSERTEAVEALRHTMRATRELSHKYHLEKEAREHAERINQQLLQAKANLSAATLDALYQERRKSAALEKSLAMVPLVLKWRSACVPAMDVSVAERQASQEAADQYALHYSSSSSAGSERSIIQACRDVNVVAKDISHIVRHLDTAAGLQDGVNATFDWLLSGEGASGATEAANNATPTPTIPGIEHLEEQKSEAVADPGAAPIPLPSSPAAERVFGATLTESASAAKSPSIAALMAEAYKNIEFKHSLPPDPAAPFLAPSPPAPLSMVSELQRLRDELRRIETNAPDMSATSDAASVSSTTTVHKPLPDSTLSNISITTSMNLSSCVSK